MNLLSSKEKSELRGYAQRLKPAVHVGKNGLAAAVVAELRKAFEREELIKIAFKAERAEIENLCAEVERLTESQCVGGVGKKRSFYRKMPEVAEVDA
ncbi:YhbY family RNA-binding protein [Pelagicoccus sp. NFK12]|uniref:YhbY family RNA-binding protein n=1 Tax=Pelagicoccus enzymogenes TaxID=2773457 RepID=A0A927F6T7_9BACT|nr:YhbY family RNA-binding protein [Pelagicoccus enzymogenes]MBD5778751.1 YhbY family RNA-binding protein [Pelagicoccus enzymogenes]MDQ8197502.1 YhbY family RNA-binding protein [Pelagicoccus enzymogenes]